MPLSEAQRQELADLRRLQELEAKFGAKPEKPQSQSGQAALEGFGQGVGMGYLPQLQAGVEGVRSFVDTGFAKAGVGPETPEMVNERLRDQGFVVEDPQDKYVSRRDINIKQQERLAESNPGPYYGGQVAGVLASAPAAAKALGKIPLAGKAITTPAKGLVGRSTQAAASGAILGAAQNPGDVEGRFDPIQADLRKKNALTGAALGSAAELGTAAVRGAANVTKALPENAKKWSQIKAFKSSGAMLKDFRAAFGKGRVEDLGQEMFDSGLAKPGMTYDDVAKRSQELKNEVGEKIGQIYDRMRPPQPGTLPGPGGASTPFQIHVDPKALGHELRSAVAEVRPKLDADIFDAKMEKQIETLLSDPSKLADVRYVNDVIGELDQMINHAKRANEMPVVQQGYLRLRQALRKNVNDLADAVGTATGNRELGNELKALNKRYGNLAEISSISRDRVARENANRYFSLGDRITGAGFGAAGSLPGLMEGDYEKAAKGAALGLVAAGASRGARLYGLPAAASAANKVGGFAAKLPSPVSGTLSRGAGLLSENPVLLGQGAARLSQETGFLRSPGLIAGDDKGKAKSRSAAPARKDK